MLENIENMLKLNPIWMKILDKYYEKGDIEEDLIKKILSDLSIRTLFIFANSDFEAMNVVEREGLLKSLQSKDFHEVMKYIESNNKTEYQEKEILSQSANTVLEKYYKLMN